MGGRGARSPRAHVRPRRCEDGRLGDRGRACRCTPDAPRPYTVFTALSRAALAAGRVRRRGACSHPLPWVPHTRPRRCTCDLAGARLPHFSV